MNNTEIIILAITLILILAAISIQIGTSKWFDKMMKDIGKWLTK